MKKIIILAFSFKLIAAATSGITNNGIQVVDLGTIMMLIEQNSPYTHCTLEKNGYRAICTNSHEDLDGNKGRAKVKSLLNAFLPGAQLEHYKLQSYKNIISEL